jgi:hypothetical protein
MLGRHITSVTATVQVVSTADGSLVDAVTGGEIATLVASSGSYPTHSITFGIVDEINTTAAVASEDISAVTSTHAHHVPISRRDSMVLTEILRTGTTSQGSPSIAVGNAFLANLWHSSVSRVVKLVFSRAGNTETFYGRMTSYNEPIRRGRNVGRLTVQMIDPNQANTAYA